MVLVLLPAPNKGDQTCFGTFDVLWKSVTAGEAV
eukprot:COSAG02_NODE_40771_length_401_cov_1.397351_1_plen_33_part_01